MHLTYYSNIDPDKTVEIVNYMKEHAASGASSFMMFIPRKKRQMIRKKRIQGCSSSREIPANGLPSATRTIQFIFEHAEELEVNTDGYSLWGGKCNMKV